MLFFDDLIEQAGREQRDVFIGRLVGQQRESILGSLVVENHNLVAHLHAVFFAIGEMICSCFRIHGRAAVGSFLRNPWIA